MDCGNIAGIKAGLNTADTIKDAVKYPTSAINAGFEAGVTIADALNGALKYPPTAVQAGFEAGVTIADVLKGAVNYPTSAIEAGFETGATIADMLRGAVNYPPLAVEAGFDKGVTIADIVKTAVKHPTDSIADVIKDASEAKAEIGLTNVKKKPTVLIDILKNSPAAQKLKEHIDKVLNKAKDGAISVEPDKADILA